MKIFKKFNQGFSFIEIILAIAILAIVLTGLFNLQSNIFNTATRENAKTLRIYYIKNLFFDPEINEKIEKEKTYKKNLQEPSMQLTYQFNKPNEKSALKNYENIYILKANGQWTFFRPQEETFINLIFKKPEIKAKNE